MSKPIPVLLWTGGLVSYVFFVRASVLYIFNVVPLVDTFVNGCVAKHIAMGQGWIASIGAVPKLFSPEITTGGPVLLPAALMIRLFGPQIWVPGFANFLLWNILLIVAIWRLSRFTWIGSGGLLISFLYLSQPLQCTQLLGDPVAALTLIIGAIFLFQSNNRRGMVIGSGFLSIASNTKLICWLGAIALASVFFAINFRRGPEKASKATSGLLLTALVSPFLIDLLKIFFIPSARSDQLSFTVSQVLNTTQPNDALVHHPTIILVQNIKRNIFGIASYFGGPLGGIIMVAVTIFSLFLIRGLADKEKIKPLALGLLAASIVQIAVWTVIDSRSHEWRLAPAIIIWGTTLFLFFDVFLKNRRWIFPLAAAILTVSFPAGRFFGYVTHAPRVRSPMIGQLKQAANVLAVARAEHPDAAFYTIGWFASQDLDYLLPSAFNFFPCTDHVDNHEKLGTCYLAKTNHWNDPYEWCGPMNNWEKIPGHALLHTPYYVISREPNR